MNTIIPYSDDDYRLARAKLAIPTSEVLKCDDADGFHPSMSGLHDLLQNGQFAAVRSVGYEKPNRSHFESMDIWHTCRRKDEPRPDGWLGRGRLWIAGAKRCGENHDAAFVARLATSKCMPIQAIFAYELNGIWKRRLKYSAVRATQ